MKLLIDLNDYTYSSFFPYNIFDPIVKLNKNLKLKVNKNLHFTENVNIKRDLSLNSDNKIYCLKLKEDKYYIGKTVNMCVRLNQHLTGKGALWTEKYKPIDILFVIKEFNYNDEFMYTLFMMKIFGIDNIRGFSGKYCSLEFDPIFKASLIEKLNETNIEKLSIDPIILKQFNIL